MTRKRKIVPNSSRVRRQSDPIPTKYCILSATCGLFLLAGFFLAANFHFNSVSTAMENSKLRKELNQLKDENRKLTVNRSKEASPKAITTRATSLGFSDSANEPPVRSADYKVIRTAQTERADETPKVVRTASVKRIAVPKKEKVEAKKSQAERGNEESFVASLSGQEVSMGER